MPKAVLVVSSHIDKLQQTFCPRCSFYELMAVLGPTGKLWHSIYDETGQAYQIREARNNYDWIVFEPTGLVEEKQSTQDDWHNFDGQRDGPATTQEKGKGRADDGTMNVKCRLSHTGKDYVIRIGKNDTMGMLRKTISEITGVSLLPSTLQSSVASQREATMSPNHSEPLLAIFPQISFPILPTSLSNRNSADHSHSSNQKDIKYHTSAAS
jgi:hypothetical protein